MTSCAFTRGESNSGRESDFGTTPVYLNSFAGIKEPLSICGRLPELPGDLGCLG